MDKILYINSGKSSQEVILNKVFNIKMKSPAGGQMIISFKPEGEEVVCEVENPFAKVILNNESKEGSFPFSSSDTLKIGSITFEMGQNDGENPINQEIYKIAEFEEERSIEQLLVDNILDSDDKPIEQLPKEKDQIPEKLDGKSNSSAPKNLADIKKGASPSKESTPVEEKQSSPVVMILLVLIGIGAGAYYFFTKS